MEIIRRIDVIFHPKVSTESVREYGTLLQDAVVEQKKNFVQILLDFGFVPLSFLFVAF